MSYYVCLNPESLNPDLSELGALGQVRCTAGEESEWSSTNKMGQVTVVGRRYIRQHSSSRVNWEPGEAFAPLIGPAPNFCTSPATPALTARPAPTTSLELKNT